MFGTSARSALKSSASIASLGIGLAVFAATPAFANPSGAQVSSGSATVSAPSSNKTVVNQSSQGVVINWKSFDIGAGQTTQFVQPNQKSIAINRIGSQNASQILGTLSANGKIVLINPNGIAFGKGSKVNVGALIATTTDGSDSDLLGGRFTKAGSAKGYVTNAGRINANGTVALVAPSVSNTGVVNAKIGSVNLGGTNKFTVDFNGDGLVSFATGDASKASVNNTGKITGANVSMTARTAEGLATGVVNTSGIVTATGVNKAGGSITLDAGNGGKISVTNAKLVATGVTGGGNVTIGGWNHGSVSIDKQSSIDASAIGHGNGGNVSIISANTSVKGAIDARGGKSGGNGGRIETSGGSLDFATARVDAKAGHGTAGQWVLDPSDLTIDATAAATIRSSLQHNTNVTLQTTSSTTTGPGIVSSGLGDINIQAAVSWTTAASLTIDAYHSINVSNSISLRAGTLNLQYNDAATDGMLNFSGVNGGLGQVLFTSPATYHPTVSINGNPLTLVSDLTTLINDIASNPNGGYALTGNISATTPFTSAVISTPFNGVFNGLGYSITGLSMNAPTLTNVGLFAHINAGAVVGGVAVSGVATGGNSVGLLAGENDGTIFNAASSGTVTAVDYTNDTQNGEGAGGLVGVNTGIMNFDSSSANVFAYIGGGGLVGFNFTQEFAGNPLSAHPTIENSFATGNVTGKQNAAEIAIITSPTLSGALSTLFGGLVGQSATGIIGVAPQYASYLYNDYATGNVTGESSIGGLAGNLSSGVADHVYATGNVTLTDQTGDSGNAGGLIGYVGDQGTVGTVVSNAFATGDVTGVYQIGGLVGIMKGGDTITNSYATGNVAGVTDSLITQADVMGGLVGYSRGAVVVSYATGNVSGDYYVGGLVGQIGTQNSNSSNPGYFTNSAGSIVNSYAANSVTGLANTGALVGVVSGPSVTPPMTITGGYYDTDRSGPLAGIGAVYGGNVGTLSATGLTTAQMEVASNYSFASDFGGANSGKTWAIIDIDGSANNAGGAQGGALPMLISEYSTNVSNAHQLELVALDPTASYKLINDVDLSGSANSSDVWVGDVGFAPIGGLSAQFTGTFDGQGHHVTGLWMNQGSSGGTYIGLFGYIGSTGTVKNTNVAGTIYGGSAVGLLVGENDGVVLNDSSSGTVIGVDTTDDDTLDSFGTTGSAVGGLVGFSSNLINQSHSSATVQGSWGVGGLVGQVGTNGIVQPIVENSYATGVVSQVPTDTEVANFDLGAFAGAGGLIGQAGISQELTGTLATNLLPLIQNDYATGDVSGPAIIGGLMGDINSGTVINVWATGNVTGTYAPEDEDHIGFGSLEVGGLIGFMGNEEIATLTNGWASGTVTGNLIVGGLVGTVKGLDTISHSYSTGDVYANGIEAEELGGFVGFLRGAVTDSYSLGNVYAGSGAFSIGGFAGQIGKQSTTEDNHAADGAIGSLNNVYESGAVTADAGTSTFVGALVGVNVSSGILGAHVPPIATNITNANYNTTKNAGLSAVASGFAGTTTGLTTAQMVTLANYSLSDAGTAWVVVDLNGTLNNASGSPGGTLPMLLSEYSTTITNAHQLQLIATNLGASYSLGGNIDLSATLGGDDVWGNAGFIDVGSNSTASDASRFTGTLDGKGFAIDNLYESAFGTAFAGLFGAIGTTGLVENVNLTNVNVTQSTGGSFAALGGLAAFNYGTVTNATISGNVTANTGSVGGLVGFNFGTVSNSSSDANVQGYGNGTSFTDLKFVGGLVGVSTLGSTISNSSATNDVVGHGNYQDVGGLSGGLSGTITGGYSTGDVFSFGATGDLVGGLVGGSDVGTISKSYSTSNVELDGSGAVGGLVGSTSGAVSQSFSTGAVLSDGNAYVGGLVGNLGKGATTTGSITDSFSFSSVSLNGGTATVGGLVGINNGTVATSFATGWINATPGASVVVGGLIGSNTGTNTGTTTKSYWDPDTTGISTSAGGTSMTTVALQRGLPSGFTLSSWATIPGQAFPYLKWMFPSGAPQTISGNLYTDNTGTTGIGGATGFILVNGQKMDAQWSMASGADGYYYVLLNPGTLGGNQQMLLAAYNPTSGLDANAFVENVSGSLSNVNMIDNYTTLYTSSSFFSDTAANYLTAAGEYIGRNDLGILDPFGDTSNLDIESSATTYDIDMDVFDDALTIRASGTVTESGSIMANTLNVSGEGDFTLDSADNEIGSVGSTDTVGSLRLVNDGDSLSVGDLTSDGNVSLTTTGDLAIAGALDAGTANVALAAGGKISESGAITAANLSGSSVGGALLILNNLIGSLGSFSNTGGGDLRLTNGQSFTVTGNVSDGTGGSLVLTTSAGDITIAGLLQNDPGSSTYLTSAGSIIETGPGAITAGYLHATATGAVSLTGANHLTNITSVTAGSAGISLTNAQQLDLGINLTTSGNIALATTSGDLNVTGTLSGATITYTSAGKVNDTAAVTATTVTGSSIGGAALSGSNAIVNLGAFTNAGSGGFTLNDGRTLSVTGAVNAGTGDLTLSLPSYALSIKNTLAAGGVVSLTSAGATESGAGAITAGTLSGNSTAAVSLGGLNQVANLGTFTDLGSFLLTNSTGLAISGSFSAGSTTLNVGGALSESGSGSLSATTLKGSSSGGAALSNTNHVATLAGFTNTGGGGFSLLDDEGLSVSGAVDAGTGNLSISTTSGQLSITNLVSAGGTASLSSAGAVRETGSGAIHANTLTGSAGSSVALTGVNQIANLGAFTETGGTFALSDSTSLVITGLLSSTVPVALNISGTLSETGSGAISATMLSGSATGGVTLNGANMLSSISGFANSGAGGFALTDGRALSVTGALNAGTGDLSLTTTSGALTLTSALTAGGTVSLNSQAGISESGSGAITANMLTGSSGAAASLGGLNQIASLGAFTDTGSFLLKDVSALAITDAVSAGATTLTVGGQLSESGSGKLLVSTLTGSSSGGAILNGANAFSTLSAFTNTGSGGFALTDSQALSVAGNVGAGTGDLSLTTTSGSLSISGQLTAGGTVTLSAASTLKETGGGKITASSLSGGASGTVTLTGANLLGGVSNFSVTGGSVTLTNAQALNVTGAFSTDNAMILNISGTLSESGSGAITSANLSGSSVGGVTLNGANHVLTLASFTNGTSGDFAFTNADALSINGAINDGAGTVSLTSGGTMTIKNTITGGTVNLTSTTGQVKETGLGAITASLLNVMANTGILLTGPNHITTIGTDATVTGPNTITNM